MFLIFILSGIVPWALNTSAKVIVRIELRLNLDEQNTANTRVSESNVLPSILLLNEVVSRVLINFEIAY